jgi:hypothetical protein
MWGKVLTLFVFVMTVSTGECKSPVTESLPSSRKYFEVCRWYYQHIPRTDSDFSQTIFCNHTD